MAVFGRIKQINPVMLAGMSFLIFAPIELIAGYSLHNPAISANASHDAFDGLFFLFGGSVDLLLARSTRHSLYCWSRKGLSITVGLLASVFVGLGLLFEQSSRDGVSNLGREQLIVAFILGPASICLNWYWHRRLEEHGDEHHHGYDIHLIVDAGSGFIVIIAAIITFLLADGIFNLLGGYIILGLALALGLRALWSDFPKILHSHENHPMNTGHNHGHHSVP